MADKPPQQSMLQSLRNWGGTFTTTISQSIHSPHVLSTHSHPEYFGIHSHITILTTPLENSVPPTLLATLITAQHARPFQPLPMLFPPVLLFSSYLNLSNYKTDAAGITAAWSGLYALLALRRSQVSKHLNSSSSCGLCCIHVIEYK